MSTLSASSRKQQIDALDGLRGLAVLLVVASHTSHMQYYYLPGLNLSGIGKPGVYLFFMLSSFLLTRPRVERSFNILDLNTAKSYWSRRFLRIFPVYGLYLIAGLVTTTLAISIGGKVVELPFSLTLVEFWQHLTLQEGKEVTWSVPVEFKYYLVLPIVALFLRDVAKLRVIASAVSICAVILIITGIRVVTDQEFELLHTSSYLEAFLLGALAAVLRYQWQAGNLRELKPFVVALAIISGLGLILTTPLLFSALFYPIVGHYFAEQVLLFSALWFFILSAIVMDQTWLNRTLSQSWIRFIGWISFSLYLVHYPMLKVFLAFGLPSMLSAWLVLVASVLVSWASYRLIEKPSSRIRI